MKRERRLRALLFLGRSLLFLFVVYHLNRYAENLVNPLFFLPFYGGALYAGARLGARRFRLLPALVMLLLAIVAIWVISGAFFSLLTAVSDNPRVDAIPTIFEFLFLPTAPTVALAFLFAYLAARFTRFPVYEAFVLALFAFGTFFPQGEYRLTLYDHPISLVVAAMVLFSALVTVLTSERYLAGAARRPTVRGGAEPLRGRASRLLLLLFVLLPVGLLSVIFVYNQYAEGSLEEGGGLLQPTLFRFDFSDYLSLESEISLSRDLVLLYHETRAPQDRLLRRYVLSGYDPSRGFYRDTDVDRVPDRVGGAPQRFGDRGYRERRRLEQEYYIVNFDPGSLVAVNYPVRVAPLRNWRESSFNAIYRVESEASTAGAEELAAAGPPRDKDADWLDYYTAGGDSPILRRLAEDVTADADSYYGRVRAIERYLQEEYFYSLKPGAAADGDQLNHFLFNSRKGYCSYFAFSMALMTRSLGIPSRVAVGFFLDPRQEVLNFHPVRANMAHAWVEVYFDGFGWIEFDPTSQQLAPGEEFDLSMGADQEQVASLLEEIFSRQDELEELRRREQLEQEDEGTLNAALRRLRRGAPYLLPVAALLLLLLLRNRSALAAFVAREPRRRGQLLFMHAARRICGLLPTGGPPFRWPEALPPRRGAAVTELLPGYQRALFAPGYDEEDLRELRRAWRGIRRAAGWPRRLASSLLPVAMVPAGDRETPGSRGGGQGRSVLGTRLTAIGFAFILGALVSGELPAQEQVVPEPAVETAQTLLDRAWQAIDRENYEEAIRVLQRGQERFPEAIDISLLLGDLFYDRQLYSLALEAYRTAEATAPTDYDVLFSVATAYGRLNEERTAIEYLERLDSIHEAGPEVVSDLGWLYFKTHQLEEGERRLLRALESQGEDRYITMTLGTIYADMYEYEKSKRRYLQAIDSALADGAETFASVAYYNLSLLEKSFYNFEDALSYTGSSIELAERPSGYLAQGELYEQQMDTVQAYRNYRSAYVLDDETPLPKLSLAALYQRYGRLDDALAYTREILDEENRGWMYNFGTDLSRHAMDIHGLLADIYSGLSRTRWLNRERSVPGFFAGLTDRLRYAVLGWYHDVVHRRAAMRSADSYYDEGSTLNAYWTYRVAYDRRPAVALEYLQKARAFETELIPESEPFYRLHEGALREDPSLVAAARRELDPVWERSEIATALREELNLIDPRREPERYVTAAAQLYLLNPGAFQQYGLTLPVEIVAEGGVSSGELRRLRRGLQGRGVRFVEGGLRLEISAEGPPGAQTAEARLVVAGRELRRFRYGLGGGGRQELSGFAATIVGTIFEVELG